MTSDCTETLILTFTSKKRHCVGLYKQPQSISICQKEDVYWHFIGLIFQTPDLFEIDLNEVFFFHFSIDFIKIQKLTLLIRQIFVINNFSQLSHAN